MGIRIDELNATINPSRDHEFPAMRDGVTVRLTVGQVVDLATNEIRDGVDAAVDTLAEMKAAIDAVEATAAAAEAAVAGKVDASHLTGSVAFFAITAAPSGWLKANGAAVSRTAYADLFAVIGTTFGVGDGSTTFNLPDLRGEFVRAWSDGGSVDAGRTFGSTQGHAFAAHTHSMLRRSNPTAFNGNNAQFVDSAAGGSTGNNSNGVGSSGADETRPRNVALLACIRY